MSILSGIRWRRDRSIPLAAAICVFLLTTACSGDPQARKQAYIESGDRYVADGKFSEAVIEYRNAVQIDPLLGTARVKLAKAYMRLGDGRNALAEHVRAADLLPDDADVQIAAGEFLLAAGRAQEALGRADKVLAGRADHVAAHVLRGNALGGLNDLDNALASIEEALRLDPARGATYTQLGFLQLARGRQIEAEAALKKAIEFAPKAPDGHLALANLYWASGRTADAEQSFTAALALEPAHVGANRAMALFSITTGRPERAEGYLKQAAAAAKSPSTLFALTDYYVARGQAARAIELLRPEAEAARQMPGAKARLARAHASTGDRARAHALADELIAEGPQDARARLLKGQLLLEDGNRDGALTNVLAAVSAEPQSTEAQFLLGRLYSARGDIGGAERAFQEVLKLNPRAAAAQAELAMLRLRAGNAAGSLEMAEAATANQPQSLDARLALVRSLLASKAFDRAEKELQALVTAQPRMAILHAHRGTLAAARGDRAGAAESFEHALTLDSDIVDAVAGLVALDLSAGNLDSARRRVTERLQGTSPKPEYYLLAARTFVALKDLPAAESVLRQAVEKQPTLLPAYAMLGQLYVAQRRMDEARAEFDALAERQTRPVGALTMSGIILQTSGRAVEARQRFERALAIDSRSAVAANNLAWMFAESGENLEQAVRLAETAAEVLPNSPEVLDTLGWAYLRSNLPALAVPALERATEKAPTTALYQYHLGLSYERAGDVPRARRALSRALALQPDFPNAAEAKQTLAKLDETAARQ